MNFDDLTSQISTYFTIKDAIWLPSWGRPATPEDGRDSNIEANLINLFKMMDRVRQFFNKPIIIHVTYRPQAYNKQIGGAPNSSHVLGKACDFNVEGVNCDDARALLEPKLEEFGVRMEKLPGSNWVHLDMANPNPNRYFIP